MKQKKFQWLAMVLAIAFALGSVPAGSNAASLDTSTS